MRNTLKAMATGAVVLALTGVTGCATNGDIDTLRADLNKTNATATQAASDAASAKSEAAAARVAAEEARDTSQETNEKLDRMFKKSMYK
jgi:murein lipoprotein